MLVESRRVVHEANVERDRGDCACLVVRQAERERVKLVEKTRRRVREGELEARRARREARVHELADRAPLVPRGHRC